MPHPFFLAKRPWSKYKDSILRFYLEPYIAKVAKLKKPILIVDCFAGCGAFGDGEPGSPLIIAPLVKKWAEKGVNVRDEFIEADADNFQSLKKCLQPYADFVTTHHGSFEAHLPGLAQRAKDNTVFLYVDPYTVKGLVFDRMKAVYDQIHRTRASVELLLNFNAGTFMRWALAALKRQGEVMREDESEVDFLADDPAERVEMTELDSIAGGDYWRGIAELSTAGFPEKVALFTDRYRHCLLRSFTYAASYEVKDKYEHRLPKYALIFCTRHPDGVELMNDAMCNARQAFLGSQFRTNSLFDMTPDEEVSDTGQLKNDLRGYLADGRMTREGLRHRALLQNFCRFHTKDVNRAIGELLKAGVLFSNTGKTKVNDKVVLSAISFGQK